MHFPYIAQIDRLRGVRGFEVFFSSMHAKIAKVCTADTMDTVVDREYPYYIS